MCITHFYSLFNHGNILQSHRKFDESTASFLMEAEIESSVQEVYLTLHYGNTRIIFINLTN